MKRRFFHLQILKSKVFLFISTLITVGILATTAWAWLVSPAESGIEPLFTEPAQSSALPRPASAPQLATERITIRPDGFDPKEITRPAGEVIMAIDNRSGLEEIRLRLDREDGPRIVDESVNRKKLDWRKRVNLQPGHYRLTEANHPDWLCQLTITP